MADTEWYPDSYQSAKVLNAIRAEKLSELSQIPPNIMSQLDRVAVEFRVERQHLPSDCVPRNLPFYHLIKRRYPRFRWLNVGQQIDIEAYYKGRKHSVLAYLLGMIPQDQVASTANISLQEFTGFEIAAAERYIPTLASLGACSLSPTDMSRLNTWIERAAAGLPSTIVSPVCPDYSAERGEERRFRFTFQTLGTGCGLSGLRLLESIAGLHHLLIEVAGRVSLVHHVCVGDFEALDGETVHRLGVDVEEFQARNRATARALALASPVEITPSLFTDHCGGLPGWRSRHEAMKRRITDPTFYQTHLKDAISEIAEARLGLYRRWFAEPEMGIEAAIPIVLQQGAEYATMGQVIVERFPNPLIVGADHHKMAPFYHAGCDAPVLYFDRNYD